MPAVGSLTDLRRTWAVLLSLLLCCACHKKGPPGALDQSGYHVRNGVVYFLPNWTSKAFIVEQAEAATLETPLPGGTVADYAKDRRHVFYRGTIVDKADPATFEILDDRFARDAQHVFSGSRLLCDDSPHFTVVSANFVKNSRSVYRLHPAVAIVSEDAAHFREISSQQGYSHCADRQHVYVNGNLIETADPNSFKILTGGYARDATQTYYFDAPMPVGTDADTLEIMTGGYARDRSRVYHLGKLLPEADPSSFVVTDDSFQRAHDARRHYERGSPVPGAPTPQARTAPQGLSPN